jgi:hypothetical protein
MKKLFVLATGALMSLLLVAAVNAGPSPSSLPEIQTNDDQNTGQVTDSGLSPNNFLGNPNDDVMNQDEKIIRPKAGISWREQVMKERGIMRRGAELRNANLRNAYLGKKEQVEGLDVNSYNDLIKQRNASLQ